MAELDSMNNMFDYDFSGLGDIDDDIGEVTLDGYFGEALNGDLETEGVITRLERISDALAEEIVIINTIEQIKSQEDILVIKQNYINLFINKYSNMFDSLDILDGDDKTMIKGIAERLTLTILAEIETRYGVSIGQETEDNIDLDELLKDLSTLYEFFVIRNVQNIIDIFVNDLNNEAILQPFVDMLSTEQYDKDLFIQSDLKKGLDPRIAAVTHFTHLIIDTLATNNSDSLYALINRIIQLDLYEETNMRMHQMLIEFGTRFQIIINDTDAAKLYFELLYNSTIKSYIANEVINKYIKNVL